MNPTDILNTNKTKIAKRIIGCHSKVQISKRLQQIINGCGSSIGDVDDLM
jgi:hypothetical protein